MTHPSGGYFAKGGWPTLLSCIFRITTDADPALAIPFRSCVLDFAGAPLFAVFAKGGMGLTRCLCRKLSGKADGSRLKLLHRKVGESRRAGLRFSPAFFCWL